MFLEKALLYLFVLALFTVHCRGTKKTNQETVQTSADNTELSYIKLTDLNGKTVRLSDFAGKPVFLNFWATWCGPCASEMPSIETASRQFKDDIVFLAVSNESPATIQAYLKKHPYKLKFAHLEVSYLDVYVVNLPTTMLIDRNGHLVSEEEGFRLWTESANLEKLNALVKR